MESEMCSICQEDLTGTLNILTTKCNHKFHTDCYVKYINSSRKNCCPMCRQNIFDGVIETNNRTNLLDVEYHDYITHQNQTLITSLRNENRVLLCRNEILLDKIDSLKHYIRHRVERYNKEVEKMQSYDEKKYFLLRKKNNIILNI